MADFYASYPVGGGSGGGGGGVTSLNGLTGALDLTSSTLNITESGGSVDIEAQGDPNTFASFDNSGNLETAPGWGLDQNGQATASIVGTFPTDNITSLVLFPDISTPLTGGYEGIIVGATMSSSMAFQSSYNVENTYVSGFSISGGIEQYQEQSQFNSGATAANYTSYGAFPNIAGTTSYTGFNLDPTLTSTSPGDTLVSMGGNLNSGYANSGGFIALNEAVNFNTGASVNSYTSFNADPNLNGTIANGYTGMSLNPNINGTAQSYTGIQISPNGTTTFSQGGTGISIALANLTGLLPQDRSGIESDSSINFDVTVPMIAAQSFQVINRVESEFTVTLGSPITGTDSIGGDFAGDLNAQDNIAAGPTGGLVGWTGVGFISEVLVGTGKTVDTANMFLAAAALPAPTGSDTDGGTVTNMSMIKTATPLSEGGSLNITNLYGFHLDARDGSFAGFSTNAWGFYIDDSALGNFISGNLAIGTITTKVSNGSVALEVGGTTKAVRFPNMTTTQKLALTALAGMQVFDITLNQMSYYNGAIWINF